MAFSDSFWRAVADYGDRFPDLPSLGANLVAWHAEMDRIRRTAFASVLLTANGGDGSSTSGQRQFSQEVLADALRCRRYDLDNTYELPPHLASYPEAKPARARAGRGRVLKFSPC